jgi:hypothetical protein
MVPTIIPTTVLNGKVLLAIFAIGHNVPMSISKGKGTLYNIRCPSFLFFAADSFTCSLRHREIDKKCAVFINYSGSNKK